MQRHLKMAGTICLFALTTLYLKAQNRKAALAPTLFSHLHLNVVDKDAAAQWYVDNIGLEIIPSANKDVVYVADKDHNFMFEFASDPHFKNTYDDINLNAYHIAFEGHKTIEQVGKKVLKNGGTQVGEIYKNKVGDYVLNLRDPSGFPLQLIHRTQPFYEQPVKSTIRFEHFAFNVAEQKNVALWYVQFMNLTIPWSKDINKDNGERNYRVPYLGDAEGNMSLELFAKEVPTSLSTADFGSIHIAFATEEPQKLAEQMVQGGAKIINTLTTLPNGDRLIDLKDPQGVPIRLLHRKKKLLK